MLLLLLLWLWFLAPLLVCRLTAVSTMTTMIQVLESANVSINVAPSNFLFLFCLLLAPELIQFTHIQTNTQTRLPCTFSQAGACI